MNSPQIDLIVHATHEAGFRSGGIGAVLDGLLSTAAYGNFVQRTILVGPMDCANSTQMAQLVSPGNKLQIIFSSWHGIDEAPENLSEGLRAIELRFRVKLCYGTREFAGSGPGIDHEVLLVDARWADLDEINAFKLELWRYYRIESDRFEWISEFDLVLKAARPAYAAICLLAGENDGGQAASRYLIAHEWMGMPLALCAQVHDRRAWRLIFYAHEMATARILVEDHPGHDTRFYNVLEQALAADVSLDKLFGDRGDFFKHRLISQARHFDGIFVVGEWVKKEMQFLGADFRLTQMDVVFNGVLGCPLSLDERNGSNQRLAQYCQNLLGYRPEYVFSHVTRLSVSKGLWRDIRVLEHLDGLLAQDGKMAVLFLLSSSVPSGRPVEDVLRWEATYGWPVVHHLGNGDLVGHEVALYRGIEAFNARSRTVKIVFVNQCGWSRDQCGTQMPAEMVFDDLRRGTDAEFGQSVYEPFGISQVEPLAFGAISVVSNVCGCVDFVKRAAQEAGVRRVVNLLEADYTTLTNDLQVHSPWDALWIDQNVRDQLERSHSHNVALAIRATLPVTLNQRRAMLQRGQQLGERMSWEIVVTDYLIPALQRVG